jgi:hypothetical protein
MSVIGNTYNEWTVLAECKTVNNRRYVLAQCSCELATTRKVTLVSLKNGRSKSCGCFRNGLLKTHGLSKHHLYKIWCYMIQRCTNKNNIRYCDYGARGILVCDEWKRFENFFNDMNESWVAGLTLDRKNNDLGYSKENCKWSSMSEQNRNRRSNVNITFNGKTQCLTDWCKELGLKYKNVNMKIYRGSSPEKALGLT